MKKMATAILLIIILLSAACSSKMNTEYFEPTDEQGNPVVISPAETTVPPDIIDTGGDDSTFPNGENGNTDSPADPTAPVGGEGAPAFLSPLQAIQEGMNDQYGGAGSELVELKGFKLYLGEVWVLTDENAQGADNEKIIDGPVRYTTDDGANMIIYVQDNQAGWDAHDEEVNKSVADTVMQSNNSYILLEQSTLDTPLGKGLMIYYRIINPEDTEHNQRACLVLVPVDNKILAISAGALDSNDDVVFSFAYRAVGQALASAEAEYI